MKDRAAWKQAGAWLRESRLAAEITQRELAEQIGAPDASWIAEIESGRLSVPVALYKGYARAFAMPETAFAARCAAVYRPVAQPIDAAA